MQVRKLFSLPLALLLMPFRKKQAVEETVQAEAVPVEPAASKPARLSVAELEELHTSDKSQAFTDFVQAIGIGNSKAAKEAIGAADFEPNDKLENSGEFIYALDPNKFKISPATGDTPLILLGLAVNKTLSEDIAIEIAQLLLDKGADISIFNRSKSGHKFNVFSILDDADYRFATRLTELCYKSTQGSLADYEKLSRTLSQAASVVSTAPVIKGRELDKSNLALYYTQSASNINDFIAGQRRREEAAA